MNKKNEATKECRADGIVYLTRVTFSALQGRDSLAQGKHRAALG